MIYDEEFIGSFQEELKYELSDFISEQNSLFPNHEILKIDLHCHDHNSDVPDEVLGRIMNVPETWLKTKDLTATLKKNNCDVITITNHNNARSCFELLNKGIDVLVGAEFSCMVPDFNIGIHVLTYGFTEKQENDLNKLRKNIYAFREYTVENNIPVIWAHPLYHYNSGKVPTLEFFDKMSLVFNCFEVLNGQRDTWQNMLVKAWLEGLTPEKIDKAAIKAGIKPNQYCENPYQKFMSGGSDSHMGIFAGSTGSYLYVENLQKKLKNTLPSKLALEAIRNGSIKPYGSHQNSEKLMITFLDYVCQIALHGKDPGLLRILLHKGTVRDKMIALLVSNAFSELQRHKVTMNFIELFHNCFAGKSPGFAKRFFVSRAYKPVFDDALEIAETRNNGLLNIVEDYKNSINSISNKLNSILFGRLIKKIENLEKSGSLNTFNLTTLLEKLEIPSDIRSYINREPKNKKNKNKRISNPDLSEFLDGLSFPFLASSLILAANYTSAKVMFNNRPLLQNFSKQIERLEHPKRMLWLTDTFDDSNGVSMVLKMMHQEIKKRNLPIDILVCSNTLDDDNNLIILKPLAEFCLPIYKDQPVRIPNFMEIHRIFQEGAYDRVMCSTEGVMGLAALYLKNAFSVNAHFFIHTDWLVFVKKVLNIDQANHNRLRRLIRLYYKNFDSLFVLNTDQQKWLTSREMGIDESKVHLTAHWADDIFSLETIKKEKIIFSENAQIILFAGRLSLEKGVNELPDIYAKVKMYNPLIKLVIAGSGPAEKDLRKALPDAIFLGWVNHDELPLIYSSADLLILPSKFDTFSCVVLESLSCGLPVIAYNSKGPKDIILDGKCGYIVSNKIEMCSKIISYFDDSKLRKVFKKNALKRAKDYNKDKIMNRFLQDVDLSDFAKNIDCNIKF